MKNTCNEIRNIIKVCVCVGESTRKKEREVSCEVIKNTVLARQDYRGRKTDTERKGERKKDS